MPDYHGPAGGLSTGDPTADANQIAADRGLWEEWEDNESLPLAVGVEFTLGEDGRKPVRFRRRAALPASNLAEPVTIPEASGQEDSE